MLGTTASGRGAMRHARIGDSYLLLRPESDLIAAAIDSD
jgi:hypothetical protein